MIGQSKAFTDVTLPAPVGDKVHKPTSELRLTQEPEEIYCLCDSSIRCTQMACPSDSLQYKHDYSFIIVPGFHNMEPWIPGWDRYHTMKGPDAYAPDGMLLTHKDLQH